MIIIVCIAAISGTAYYMFGIGSGDDYGEFEIHASGDTVYYNGDITVQSYEKFREIMGQNPDVDTIVINSFGGDTVAGRDIGKIVYERELDLVVDTVCFSSCANYVFTSAADKHIMEDSFVGWHGSESQYEVLAERAGVPYREYVTNIISEAFKESNSILYTDEAVEEQYDLLQTQLQDEAEFFAMIGLDKQVTLNGLALLEDGECIGWTHTIQEMNLYNIDNVTYLSDNEYPNRQVLEDNEICMT